MKYWEMLSFNGLLYQKFKFDLRVDINLREHYIIEKRGYLNENTFFSS